MVSYYQKNKERLREKYRNYYYTRQKELLDGVKRYQLRKKLGIRIERKNVGEKNGVWKGNNVSYRGIHFWIQRNYGKANSCEWCGKNDKRRYVWANIDHTYSRNIKDYIMSCQSCHKKYDSMFNLKKHIGSQGSWA